VSEERESKKLNTHMFNMLLLLSFKAKAETHFNNELPT
jgi:hypothetical protein